MPIAKSKQTVRSLCADVSPEFVEDFLRRMDEDHFDTFPPEEIAQHLKMSYAVDTNRRDAVRIDAEGEGRFKIVIVGFDYSSGFSILCGLLSAFGLDIRAGDIYTLSRRPGARGGGRIVDIFQVTLKPGESFDQIRQREFEQELQTLTEFLASDSTNEARERLNRFLIERIEKMGEAFSGPGSPVELAFDNSASPDWTLARVQSDDTFGFLYAISNALSMRGIYIHRAKIRSAGSRATDEFLIANRWGRKIEDPREQHRLRMTVSMIKEFTRFLPEAPDPPRALRHFDQFLDKLLEISDDNFPDRAIEFLASPPGMNMLAQLLGSSDFLWDDLLMIHFPELFPSLEEFGKWKLESGPEFKAALRQDLHARLSGTQTFQEKKKVLNAFKDHRLFLTDAAHLIQTDTLMGFSHALTDLGDIVIEEGARLAHEHLGGGRGPFAIFGLGKFGGREMGYASDMELLFVHENSAEGTFFESLSHLIVDLIEARSHGIFHIDLRLRPYGEAGPWSASFEQFSKYYAVGGNAAPFERQALIKLRWVAGDDTLGRRVQEHRDSFTYSGAPWDWADAMQLRQRQMSELVKPGQINVKYSAGGIIDVEYAVQYLQLLNGAEYPEIRVTSTLDALWGLRRLQIIRENDYATLHNGYLFLRNLIDGLRIVRGDATDLLLPEEKSEECKALARRLGYRESDRAKAATHLHADIRETMKRVHEYFDMRFARGES